MIWFFDRNGEKLRYEISRDRSDGRYRLVITHPDGTESVEEIDQATELIERSVRLMNNLRRRRLASRLKKPAPQDLTSSRILGLTIAPSCVTSVSRVISSA